MVEQCYYLTMYYKQGSTFEYEGRKLLCKAAPQTFWPCHHCALEDRCLDKQGTEDAFPECSPQAREDNTQVVFYEVVPNCIKPALCR